MTGRLQRLLDNNREWAQHEAERDPAYFSKLLGQQAPEYLWIGCSDSRVPANQITGLAPGDYRVEVSDTTNVVANMTATQVSGGGIAISCTGTCADYNNADFGYTTSTTGSGATSPAPTRRSSVSWRRASAYRASARRRTSPGSSSPTRCRSRTPPG